VSAAAAAASACAAPCAAALPFATTPQIVPTPSPPHSPSSPSLTHPLSQVRLGDEAWDVYNDHMEEQGEEWAESAAKYATWLASDVQAPLEVGVADKCKARFDAVLFSGVPRSRPRRGFAIAGDDDDHDSGERDEEDGGAAIGPITAKAAANAARTEVMRRLCGSRPILSPFAEHRSWCWCYC